jgi:isopentenyldiphosphate isomerase
MTNQNLNPLDQVILVDENDQEIGTMDKVDAHRGDGLRHRAISVFLFNKSGKLLIQERSQKKNVVMIAPNCLRSIPERNNAVYDPF